MCGLLLLIFFNCLTRLSAVSGNWLAGWLPPIILKSSFRHLIPFCAQTINAAELTDLSLSFLCQWPFLQIRVGAVRVAKRKESPRIA